MNDELTIASFATEAADANGMVMQLHQHALESVYGAIVTDENTLRDFISVASYIINQATAPLLWQQDGIEAILKMPGLEVKFSEIATSYALHFQKAFALLPAMTPDKLNRLLANFVCGAWSMDFHKPHGIEVCEQIQNDSRVTFILMCMLYPDITVNYLTDKIEQLAK